MLDAYCSVKIQPGTPGELRPATCCSKIDGQELVVTTNWSHSSYDALRQTVERLLRWSAKENQPLKIHVADTAILNNRDLRKLCRRTNSQIVWLPSVEGRGLNKNKIMHFWALPISEQISQS
jgi:hypothetical protein